MLSQFRILYPQGSLTSDLIEIDRGKYIVRAMVQVDNITLATGLAAAETVEQAEDLARMRALALINLEVTPTETKIQEKETTLAAEVNIQSSSKKTNQRQSKNISQSKEEKLSPQVSLEKEVAATPKPLIEETITIPVAAIPKPLIEETITIPVAATPKPLTEETSTPPLELIAEPDYSLISENGSSPEESLPLSNLEAAVVVLEPEPELPEPPLSSLPETDFSGEVIDFDDIINRSNLELKRLGWTSEQGRNYLLQTYGKRSRHLLSDQELLEFLRYLETLPNPD